MQPISTHSEDEDTPSPLTRKFSLFNLTRRSSTSSIFTRNLRFSSFASTSPIIELLYLACFSNRNIASLTHTITTTWMTEKTKRSFPDRVSSCPAEDRVAVPVPSIPSALSLSSSNSRGAMRTPSLISARFVSAGYNSAPSSELDPTMSGRIG